jgi:rare lipoprotein A (peptidoglycan hydrolase)
MIVGAARAGSDSNPNHLGPITRTLAFTLGVLTVMLAGCSSQNYTPASPLPAASYYAPPPHESYGTSRTEVASWYGAGFAGRRTSSGETYNPEGLTAASKTLPLGSSVRVTNPDTGRSVVVRINDRGPFVRGRSLDLSHGAAQQIGLTGKGVGRVRVTPTASSTPALTSISSTYAESSVVSTSRHVSYVSYRRSTYVAVRRRHYRHTSYASSRRTVSNPIGVWLSSAVPRF